MGSTATDFLAHGPSLPGSDAPQHEPHTPDQESLVVGMGCLWGAQQIFRTLDGVTDTTVGYAGGRVADPTYREVCSDATGHAETVRVKYDTDRISLAEILARFWENHDPTQGSRQGNDVGSQYRSLLLTTEPTQSGIVLHSLRLYQQRLTAAGRGRITTTVAPLERFWDAEDYHQDYLSKNPGGYSNQRFNGISCPISEVRRIEQLAG